MEWVMVPQVQQVSLWQAFKYWLKLGFISFGGPAGQISMMHQELVDKRRWISEKRFLHALNYCMVLPGPEAQQLATYIGWLMHGVKGGLLAGGLFVLPSLLLLVLLSWIYLAFGHLPLVAGVLYGIKPAVTAIVLLAAWRIGSRALKHWFLWGIAACSFVAISVFKVPFPAILLGAALLGWLGFRVWPEIFRASNHPVTAGQGVADALIGDHSPVPVHARFSRRRTMVTLLCGIGLWLAAMAVLWWSVGPQHDLTLMGWFFTKAALLTFGGAYAVLPYVVQGGVEHYGWLSATQMMDGLALGETTPGPLIMVVSFVGFVGGWTKSVLGPDWLFAGGALAACVVTFFTFLPSFLFILLGGPVVEASRNQMRFTAPLTGITAAVVGVILNLALFFGQHVLFPDGVGGSLDWYSLVWGLCCVGLLYKLEWSILRVIGLSAAVGLIAGLNLLSV
ncbi:chromate transporter [Ketobacter alkanivorans]|uniref:Chromate transporter n=2 Tax=Ketobacter alkanivorans TaxID=1917421 RepID=A0A2K9LLU6_9GAMM|nr:chromate transporter [Ketobacter alkanivorans]